MTNFFDQYDPAPEPLLDVTPEQQTMVAKIKDPTKVAPLSFGLVEIDQSDIDDALLNTRDFVKSVGKGIEAGIAQTAPLGWTLAQMAVENGVSPFGKGTDIRIANAAKRSQQRTAEYLADMGLKGTFSEAVGNAIPSAIATIGTGILTRNPAAAGAVGALYTSTSSYQDQRNKGFSPEDSLKVALGEGIASGAVDAIGFNILSKGLQGSHFIKRVAATVAEQAAEEGLQDSIGKVAREVVGTESFSFEEYVNDGVQAMAVGAVLGVPVATTLQVIDKRAQEKYKLDKENRQKSLEIFLRNQTDVVDATAATIDLDSSPLTRDPVAIQEGKLALQKALADAEEKRNAAPLTTEQKLRQEITEVEQARQNATALLENPDTVATREADDADATLARVSAKAENSLRAISQAVALKREIGAIEKANLNNPSTLEPILGYTPEPIGTDDNGNLVYDPEDTFFINNAINNKDTELFKAKGLTSRSSTEQIAAAILERDTGQVAETQKTTLDNAKLENESAVKAVLDNRNKEGFFSGAYGAISTGLEGFLESIGNIALPISTRIKALSSDLFTLLRRLEFEQRIATNDDMRIVTAYNEAYSRLPENAKVDLDIALFNRNKEAARRIASRHGILSEFLAADDVRENIFARLQEVGVGTQYLAEHWPRRVKDVEGLYDEIGENEIIAVAKEAAAKKLKEGERPSEKQIAAALNQLFEGKQVRGVTIENAGIFKGRKIEEITPRIFDYYYNSPSALAAYVGRANEAIAAAKLFGKNMDIDDPDSVEASIGETVSKLIEQGKIDSRDARKLKNLFNARFNRGLMSSKAQALRDLAYIDTMGSPINALTQLGDLSASIYSAGLASSVQGLGKQFTSKVEVRLEELGIERLAQEFEGKSLTSEAVNTVFKLTGMNAVDRIGKTTLVNSNLISMRKKAKAKDKAFVKEVNRIFKQEAKTVLTDLAEGKMSDNIKFLLFNKLLDHQPVALSEMPVAYLKAGNGKILFTLKSFTIKQLSRYREDVYSEIREGVLEKDPKQVAKGLYNFARLYGLFVVMNASVDYLKEFIKNFFSGEDMKEPEDVFIENSLKAFGFSKYQMDMFDRRTASDVLWGIAKPPTKLVDNTIEDWKRYNDEGLTLENSRTIRSIPVGGELYYHWFGAGAENSSKQSFD